ncbi:hypothetical protein TIFTF001_037132 [Ficus carica]|uniref:Uncharacterized protein n=1 Tax=Ficus carica TaxID=3494 RepID=A0AA88E5Q0_FICCA|nr:hypothetical protein TIFTF001_037129 [Ficus carica]GMN68077.1 hypothetical protein TIFTF001_037132 [Ficus carica]
MQNQNPDILSPKVQAGTFFVSGRFRTGAFFISSRFQGGPHRRSDRGPSSFSGRLPKLGNGYGFWILVFSSVSRGLSPSATKKTTGASSATEMMTGRAFSSERGGSGYRRVDPDEPLEKDDSVPFHAAAGGRWQP